MEIRDTYQRWSDVPPRVQKAVEAYDAARRNGGFEPPMSERNKISIAPMIEAALNAAEAPC